MQFTKQELEESKIEVPYFIHLLGKPLYRLSVIRYHMMAWLYRGTEVLQGVWKDLSLKRRWFAGILLSVASIGYLLSLAMIRVVNSVMLSLNTFSTLGFGEIPYRGISRYVADHRRFPGMVPAEYLQCLAD